jgi:hypothetical protein
MTGYGSEPIAGNIGNIFANNRDSRETLTGNHDNMAIYKIQRTRRAGDSRISKQGKRGPIQTKIVMDQAAF